ncbi:MAG: Crp/Fnr family transcriptional regulator [Muribaculaceae bacterium]|nr:Crp/Fnr family transcriptional regulator [Muribaculaceae bacterium]
MDTLKRLLRLECEFQLSDELMDSFLSRFTKRDIKSKSTLISCGEIDSNVYIVKEGIFRVSHMDGTKEITLGFALPGTMVVSWFSFYYNKPSYFQIDACCDSVVLELPKQVFDSYVKESHEFSQWALSMAQCQLYYDEMKQSVINGNAKERYISLLNNRPEILQNVPLGIVASYLGVTPQYLSYIRKQLTK